MVNVFLLLPAQELCIEYSCHVFCVVSMFMYKEVGIVTFAFKN